MNYNFDEHIDRSATHALKWMELERFWGRTDLLPLWVADMDFRTPPFIIETLKQRLEHEVLGYTCPHEGYFRAITEWNRKQYGIAVRKEEIKYVPGVVSGIYLALQALTEKATASLSSNPYIIRSLSCPRLRNASSSTARSGGTTARSKWIWTTWTAASKVAG